MDHNPNTVSLCPSDQYSRYKRPKTLFEFHKKATHWTNCDDIAIACNVDSFDLLAYIRKDFDSFKIIIQKGIIRVVFLGYEPFIDQIIEDYIKINNIYDKIKQIDDDGE